MDTFLVLDEGTTYRYRIGAAGDVATTTASWASVDTRGQDHEYGSAHTPADSPG